MKQVTRRDFARAGGLAMDFAIRKSRAQPEYNFDVGDRAPYNLG